jgi:hypothetical protein
MLHHGGNFSVSSPASITPWLSFFDAMTFSVAWRAALLYNVINN